ncbi:hypothetical protein [Bacillus alkalicellulosilyticus]|uniref:hypothetical protein n=1 Tax=Alkalihalobacterium alkalicellulosilyticum TaxID=1912214 RepID=UPI0009970E43|nr:hypothetical protein [Bacillus alkalicellulosilyticus]
MRKILGLLLFTTLALTACGIEEQVTVSSPQTEVAANVIESTPGENDQEKSIKELESLLYENSYHAYTIDLPGHWLGKYGVDETKEKASFYYQSKTDIKAEIFSVYTIDEKEYQQDDLHHYLTTTDGLVYYFVLPLENPYEDTVEQVEYHSMVEEAHIAMSTFLLPNEQTSGSPNVALELFF